MALHKKSFLALWLTFLSAATCSGAQEFSLPARHEKASIEGAGWANVDYPQGRYVYGSETDSRLKAPPILFGRPERQDWQFFSWEEEQALWLLMQDKLAQMSPPQKMAFHKAHTNKNLKWPRVVVKGSEVCVPRLEKSDDDDWQEHLTCVTVDIK